MHPRPRWFNCWWRSAAILALLVPAIIRAQGFSFFTLDPNYAQHLFGVTSSFLKVAPQRGYLGGVVVLQNGDVISAECETSVTRLHRFTASSTYVDPLHRTTLHPETISNPIPGGCGITLHPDGYVYSNMFEGVSGFGVARIDVATGEVTRMGPPGNALGIAVDPVTLNLVYSGQGCKPAFGPPPCALIELNPATAAVVNVVALDTAQFGYIDGIAFDPTGEYLFLTNRFPTFDLVVMRRVGPTLVLVQKVPVTSEPVGIGIHAASPKFIVTNNQNGTMTRFDFPGDNYTALPSASQFASGGFRGDLMQAGPDGCLYLTQDGVRYDDGEPGTSTQNSIVQICDGFATPPGITPDPPPPPSSLCGFTYHDADNDGVRDGGEAPIPGVAVTLTGTDHRERPVSSATSSAADGAYCFMNLRAGTYTIAETQPPGYLDGRDTQGTPGTGTAGNDRFSNVVLAAGVNGRNNNFGELRASSLCGYVYVDADNNGIRAAGEAGIGEVAVSMTGTDDRGAAVNMPTATGVDGAYCFMSLRPGTYTIRETQPAGYFDGLDSQGTPGTGTTANDVFSNITLNQNVNGQNNNFGEMIRDDSPPTCTIENIQGPPYRSVMTFWDSGSGIATLEIVNAVNMTVAMPTFTPPSPGPLVITGTTIDDSEPAWVTVSATDFSGNDMWCDPIATTVTKLKQGKGNQTFTGIPHVEHIVTIMNHAPGLRRIDLIVNGVTFAARRLDDNEVRVIDVRSAMRPGPNNTITLVPRGRKGESALVVIADH